MRERAFNELDMASPAASSAPLLIRMPDERRSKDVETCLVAVSKLRPTRCASRLLPKLTDIDRHFRVKILLFLRALDPALQFQIPILGESAIFAVAVQFEANFSFSRFLVVATSPGLLGTQGKLGAHPRAETSAGWVALPMVQPQ
jgi:hypothetical protein